MSRLWVAGLSLGSLFTPAHRGRYAGTDIAGAYSWDAAANRWQPILDWVGYKDVNLMGIKSIAADPSRCIGPGAPTLMRVPPRG
jgi:hypothetical protein